MYDAAASSAPDIGASDVPAGAPLCERFCERSAHGAFCIESWRGCLVFSGRDRILVAYGFNPQTDAIRICAQLAADFAALRRIAQETADRVRIDFSGGRTLDLMGVRLDDLTSTHFEFVART